MLSPCLAPRSLPPPTCPSGQLPAGNRSQDLINPNEPVSPTIVFEHAACDPPFVLWASQGRNEFHGHADTRNAARTGGRGNTSEISNPRTENHPHGAAGHRHAEGQHASE